MKKLLIIGIILFCCLLAVGCQSERKETSPVLTEFHPPDWIQGTWKGTYNDHSIELEFTSDSIYRDNNGLEPTRFNEYENNENELIGYVIWESTYWKSDYHHFERINELTLIYKWRIDDVCHEAIMYKQNLQGVD